MNLSTIVGCTLASPPLRRLARAGSLPIGGPRRARLSKLILPLVILAAVVSMACSQTGLGFSFTGWSGPVVVDENVYMASKQDRAFTTIIEVNTVRGDQQEKPFGEGQQPVAIYGTPIYENSLLYSTSVYESDGDHYGRLYALDVRGSGKDWVYPETDGMGPVFGGPAYSTVTNTIYVGSDDGKLYSLDAATGEPKGLLGAVLFDAKSPIWGTPVVDAGVVYFGTLSGKVFGVNESGNKVLEFQAGGAVIARPLVEDGVVYVGSFDNNFYAIGAEKKAIWTFKAGNWFWSGAVMAQVPGTGEIIYVGSLDGNVYALNASNGSPAWRSPFKTGQGVRASPVLVNKSSLSGPFTSVSDQVLVVGSRDGKVYGIDPISGQQAAGWEAPFDARGRVLAEVGAGGNVIYVVNTNHELFALDAETGSLNRSWASGQ